MRRKRYYDLFSHFCGYKLIFNENGFDIYLNNSLIYRIRKIGEKYRAEIYEGYSYPRQILEKEIIYLDELPRLKKCV